MYGVHEKRQQQQYSAPIRDIYNNIITYKLVWMCAIAIFTISMIVHETIKHYDNIGA